MMPMHFKAFNLSTVIACGHVALRVEHDKRCWLERAIVRGREQLGPLRAGGTAGATPFLTEESQGPGPPGGGLQKEPN
jgi:hypothetical protein